MSTPRKRTISFIAILGIVGIAAGCLAVLQPGSGTDEEAVAAGYSRNPLDPGRAYRYLTDVCAFGRRPSGSEGMRKQQEYLKKHFTSLGGQVRMQEWQTVRHPERNEIVPMANMIVTWHPERERRVLLCAHYDTRPYPSEDKRNPRGTFIGANDGGSGVAVLCELAHFMKNLDSKYGVDFVLFDAEEFIFEEERDRERYFMGAKYFSNDYRANPPKHRYACGVLFDMVADKRLRLYREINGMSQKDSRQVCLSVWNIAKQLRVREFVHRDRFQIRDDHIPLNEIAKIPTVDLIDFEYPEYPNGQSLSYWHTERDTPDKCSGRSLAIVGWVVLEWLRVIQ